MPGPQIGDLQDNGRRIHPALVFYQIKLPPSMGKHDLAAEIPAFVQPGSRSCGQPGRAEFEQRVSHDRRERFDRLDALSAELVRRYRDGEASVDSLLED